MKLEDISNPDSHSTLWDATYDGSNMQNPMSSPVRILPNDQPSGGTVPNMLPICVKKLSDLANHTFKLSINEMESSTDGRFEELQGKYLIGVRPLGSAIVTAPEINARGQEWAAKGEFSRLQDSVVTRA